MQSTLARGARLRGFVAFCAHRVARRRGAIGIRMAAAGLRTTGGLNKVPPHVNSKWDFTMSTQRTHIIIPEPLVNEIDPLVGKRGRSEFLAKAEGKELRRLQQIWALERVGVPGKMRTIRSSRLEPRVG